MDKVEEKANNEYNNINEENDKKEEAIYNGYNMGKVMENHVNKEEKEEETNENSDNKNEENKEEIGNKFEENNEKNEEEVNNENKDEGINNEDNNNNENIENKENENVENKGVNPENNENKEINDENNIEQKEVNEEKKDENIEQSDNNNIENNSEEKKEDIKNEEIKEEKVKEEEVEKEEVKKEEEVKEEEVKPEEVKEEEVKEEEVKPEEVKNEEEKVEVKEETIQKDEEIKEEKVKEEEVQKEEKKEEIKSEETVEIRKDEIKEESVKKEEEIKEEEKSKEEEVKKEEEVIEDKKEEKKVEEKSEVKENEEKKNNKENKENKEDKSSEDEKEEKDTFSDNEKEKNKLNLSDEDNKENDENNSDKEEDEDSSEEYKKLRKSKKMVHFSKKNQYFGKIKYAHTFKIEDFLNYDSNGNTELNKYLKYRNRKSNHCNLILKTPNKKTKSVYIKKNRKNRNLVDDVEVSNNSLSNSVKILKGKDNPSSNINYDFLFKISLIGDSNVGKTSIIVRFIDDYFKDDTQSTIGIDFKVVSLELEPDIYGKMQIWDTCGSERFKSLTTSFIKSCTAFVLVFDLTRKNSFDNIEQWIKIINENTTPKYMILIGNKSDLVTQREVNKETVLNFCRVRKFNYLEVSAKNNDNVETMFKEVAYQLYNDIKKDKGIINTLNYWKTKYHNIKTLGISSTLEESEKDYFIFKQQNLAIGIINFSGFIGKSIPKQNKYMVNTLTTEKLSIVDKLKKETDYLIVCMNWGAKDSKNPSKKQISLAKVLASHGVDLIIGNHPSFVNPVSYVRADNGNKALVFWSLGLLIGDEKKSLSNLGALANIVISKGKGNAYLSSYSLIPIINHKVESNEFSVYKLSDYTEELGLKTDKKFSLKKIKEACVKMMGEFASCD